MNKNKNKKMKNILTLLAFIFGVSIFAATSFSCSKAKVKTIEEVNNAEVEITFDPMWTQAMMSEEAKLELGFL